MFGKKSDADWRPNEALKLAEDRFLSSIGALGKAGSAATLAMASDLVYEANYQLAGWQWMFFPVLSAKLHLLHRYLRNHGLLNRQQTKILEQTVAKLEFGNRVPPAHIIRLVRQNILKNDFNNWQVRQAFNSFALRTRKDRYLLHKQPSAIHGLCVLVQWVFFVFVSVLFVALLVDIFFTPCLPMPYVQFCVLFDACLIATLAFYQFGYQWRLGDRVMQRIWPAPVVHVRG